MNRQCIWLTGLLVIEASFRRRADCPAKTDNEEGGQAGKPRRAGRQVPICGVAVLANGNDHWTAHRALHLNAGRPAEALGIRAEVP